MNSSPPEENRKIVIRPVQYRDFEEIKALKATSCQTDANSCSVVSGRKLQQFQRWYGLLKFLSWFPNPCQHDFCFYVAEQASQQIRGLIQISPFNSTRSTWRVEQVLAEENAPSGKPEIGSQLLRHCFETIWEARTWILEVNILNKSTLALYRQNGFQPLAQLTYWAIAPELVEQLAQHEPDLPNLLPVSNADAQLIYQLDTVSMPPLLRQVFDRHLQDFKTNVLGAFWANIRQWFSQIEAVKGYVFEPQRKAAIGYFQLKICKDGTQPHQAQLTVHPAYTWLYPELLSQMARIVQEQPPQSLQLASADYQPEREEYLEQLGAQRVEHTLLMSRSVWHKLREAKSGALEGLQLSEVLQGLQPARRPIPTRMSWLKSKSSPQSNRTPSQSNASTSVSTASQASSQKEPERQSKPPKPTGA